MFLEKIKLYKRRWYKKTNFVLVKLGSSPVWMIEHFFNQLNSIKLTFLSILKFLPIENSFGHFHFNKTKTQNSISFKFHFQLKTQTNKNRLTVQLNFTKGVITQKFTKTILPQKQNFHWVSLSHWLCPKKVIESRRERGIYF